MPLQVVTQKRHAARCFGHRRPRIPSILTLRWLSGVKLAGWRTATCFYSAALIPNHPVAKSLTTEVTSISPEDVDMKSEFGQKCWNCREGQQNDTCLPLGH